MGSDQARHYLEQRIWSALQDHLRAPLARPNLRRSHFRHGHRPVDAATGRLNQERSQNENPLFGARPNSVGRKRENGYDKLLKRLGRNPHLPWNFPNRFDNYKL
jgi:hypothetical protein